MPTTQTTRPLGASGFVLGKFLPPHAGHVALIEEARRRVSRLTVIVGSLAREPIPGERRVAWLRALFPDVDVVHVTDENPQEPHEHPDFWEIWCDSIRRACPQPQEWVFSSEDYGDELARRLGIRHFCVDPERVHVPISASQIRERPAAHWEHIPAPVRPWLLKRVVVTGPESTGKSTLARLLAEHYGTACVPEFARGYLDEVRSRRGSASVCEAEDIEPIARGQLASEDAAAARATRMLICDTDLIVTKVYADHYFDVCPSWIAEEARRRRYDRHLLLDVDVPWVADSQRDQGHARARFRDVFRHELQQHGSRVVEISGDWDERFAAAVAAVDAVLDEPMPDLRPRREPS